MPVAKKLNKAFFKKWNSEFINFLTSLRSLLERMGLGQGSLTDNGTYARLNYSLKDAVKIYRIMYNGDCKLFLKRKKLVFEEFLQDAAVAQR